MIEDVIRNILYGLIASSVVGVIITIGAQSVRSTTEKLSNSRALGLFAFCLLIVGWYIGLIWYWFNILASI